MKIRAFLPSAKTNLHCLTITQVVSKNLEKNKEIRVQTVTVAADTQTDEKQLKNSINANCKHWIVLL